MPTSSNDTPFWGPAFKFGFLFLCLVAGLTVAASYLNLGIGWSTLPATTYSVENVKKEYEWFYTTYEQVDANKRIVASLEAKQASLMAINGNDTTRWPASARDEYSQTTQQVLQMQTAISAACGQYNARFRNTFHSIVAPSDLPRSCE